MSDKNKTLIVIAGPTASGKTAFAIELAKALDTVILSADSRQFYKEMSIGTAAPTAEELRQAKHYFVHHISIEDKYDVADYEQDVIQLLDALFKTHDDHHIETVMIPANGRYSVCVSTQVGCAMNCAFCRTAKMGFTRNLEAGEILEEIINVNWYLKESGFLNEEGKTAQVTNIIFMGMGEPLNNLENVHRVCCTLHNQSLFNMGSKRMTVSTSGVVPKIKELVDRNTPCCLAVSLNSTNNEYRSSVMPVNKTWPIEKLLEAVDEYIRRTDNYVTFEFVLIQDITCTPKAAKELIRICAPRRVKVNAIVLNDGDDPTLHAPTPEQVEDFLAMVRAAEIQITIRNPRGRDILAACGQLAYKKEGK